jgi:2-oxoacid:acceptor oxidoreductase delta subunit (pyruvate/2-ketoisovalerate family)
VESKGGAIVNPGSTRNNKTGSWRTFKPILDKKKCNDCDNCIMFCPEGCVNKDHDIDYDYCKGCGICTEECPVQAIKMERE